MVHHAAVVKPCKSATGIKKPAITLAILPNDAVRAYRTTANNAKAARTIIIPEPDNISLKPLKPLFIACEALFAKSKVNEYLSINSNMDHTEAYIHKKIVPNKVITL